MIKFDSLDSLNETTNSWRIKVRVLRIWDNHGKIDKKFKSRSMLLLDDKHTRMHALIWPNNTDQFENIIEEGKICSIYYFTVKSYVDSPFRCVRCDYQIWLSDRTEVVKIEDDKTEKMIRNIEFDFFDLGEIKDLINQPINNYLIDVIGVLKNTEPLRRRFTKDNKEQCTFTFTLTDGSAAINLCFWNEFGEAFCSELKKVIETPIILIVASCKHSMFKGEITVSNVAATRYYINYDHRSVQQMRHRASLPEFKQNDCWQINDAESTQVMTIAEIRKLDSTYTMKKIMCQVTVKLVKESQDWNYDVCTTCQQEVEIINGKFKCEECNRSIPFPDKRFRLCLIAEDETGGAAFILSDREVQNIIEKTVYEVIAQKEKEFPRIFKTFEGNQYTITISITDENVSKGSHNYSVVDIRRGFEKVSNDIQYASSYSMTQESFQTPDTAKSVNTNRLKRLNKGVISMTSLDDDLDDEEHEPLPKPEVPLKKIKTEKVIKKNG